MDLGWKPYVKTWLNKLPREMPESGKTFLMAQFESSIDRGLVFLHKFKEHQAIEAPDLSIVGTLCHIMAAYLDFIGSHGGFGNPGRLCTAERTRITLRKRTILNEVSKTFKLSMKLLIYM